MSDKPQRLWAVVRRGKIVTDEINHLHPMLIFRTKSAAMNALWKSDEKILEMFLHIKHEQN